MRQRGPQGGAPHASLAPQVSLAAGLKRPLLVGTLERGGAPSPHCCHAHCGIPSSRPQTLASRPAPTAAVEEAPRASALRAAEAAPCRLWSAAGVLQNAQEASTGRGEAARSGGGAGRIVVPGRSAARAGAAPSFMGRPVRIPSLCCVRWRNFSGHALPALACNSPLALCRGSAPKGGGRAPGRPSAARRRALPPACVLPAGLTASPQRRVRVPPLASHRCCSARPPPFLCPPPVLARARDRAPVTDAQSAT